MAVGELRRVFFSRGGSGTFEMFSISVLLMDDDLLSSFAELGGDGEGDEADEKLLNDELLLGSL